MALAWRRLPPICCTWRRPRLPSWPSAPGRSAGASTSLPSLSIEVSHSVRFDSDNNATACPEVLAAIAAGNHGLAVAYGDDPWTQRLDGVLGEFFGTEVRAFAVTTG